jgi:hypothetical protein
VTVTEIFPGASVAHEPQVHYIDGAARAHRLSLAGAAGVAFEEATMVREIPNHKGQRNVVGWHWSSTTDTHIAYESYLESCWLTIFDFDLTVTAMAAQPLRLVGLVNGVPLDHVPDFFLRRDDGRGGLVDVRAEALADDRFETQVAATRACCEQLGIGYDVFYEPKPQWWANVRYLAGYRRRPAVGLDQRARVLAAAQASATFDDLLDVVELPESLARPLILHLCWTQDLVFDLDDALHGWTRITTRRNVE